MNELYLEHASLLYLLNFVAAKALVSLAPDHLFPTDADECKAMLKEGEQNLARQGLVQSAWGGKLRPDASLAAIANTMAYPTIAILIIHNDYRQGLQLFWFYQSQEHIVEHTFTEEKLHHLTELRDVPALINRLETILAIQDLPHSREVETRRELDQNAFFTVKSLAKQHAQEQAAAILCEQGFTAQDAASFFHVLERPLAAGNIAFLRCDHETVIDGRNLALLQDEHSLWSARQGVPSVPVLVVETTDAATINKQLHSYFQELSVV